MAQYDDSTLDTTFAALSDATRRGVLAQVYNAETSISELAERFGMTLTGMKKHIGVLERAGLVASKKTGRVRTCRPGPHSLKDELAWMSQYRALWSARFEALDNLMAEMQAKDSSND